MAELGLVNIVRAGNSAEKCGLIVLLDSRNIESFFDWDVSCHRHQSQTHALKTGD